LFQVARVTLDAIWEGAPTGSDKETFKCHLQRFTSLKVDTTNAVRERRIRVNAVSPGATDTPGLENLLASSEVGRERRKMLSSTVPLGRFGTPDEIAKAVVFLASDDSSFITGTELFVDGGMAQV
jgi:NAD(P)-dependent dehydrogenase (short-subunit alcohol dehydrogenase family)